MTSNLERYKKDIDVLIEKGDNLLWALYHEQDHDGVGAQLDEALGKKAPDFIKSLPDFDSSYQAWYSEAKAMIRQLLPDRIEDFARHYEKPKSRKEITIENYTLEDCLQGLTVNSVRGISREKVVGPDAAIPRLKQQIAMVKSAKSRFESSLFDIRQLLQADLFDSELEAASHLLKNNFARAAGALAGVVLERHLGEVCASHKLPLRKKDPSINDLNQALKDAGVIETSQWRFVQLLGDIRNTCDHSKDAEPTAADVKELVDGVAKVTKTIF